MEAALPERLSQLILDEVDRKLAGYYNLLLDCPEATFGAYSYSEFTTVYKLLLGNALVHRYHGRATKSFGAVFMRPERMAALFSTQANISQETCLNIISDLTYRRKDARRKTGGRHLDPVYFALFEISNTEIAMVPDDFLTHEGLVGALRVAAIRSPRTFLANLSAPLGRSLTRRMKAAFEKQGFICRCDIILRDFDPELPDIDLLVISEEPTLGYYVYVCEVKNPIPPLWAKDQLRALEDTGIPKGFAQIEKILRFLRTSAGIAFLHQQFPQDRLPSFPGGFLTVVRGLLITSHNAGMFLGDKRISVIDYKTLERIVRYSDGDVTYINWALTEIKRLADAGSEIVEQNLRFGEWEVVYETVTGQPVDIAPTRYKSAGIDREIASAFIKEGGHPFDSIGGDPFRTPLGELRRAQGQGMELKLDRESGKEGRSRRRRRPRI